MRCGRVRRKLEGYMGGVLGSHVAREIEFHVAACPGCAAELRRAQRVWAALDADEAPAPRADFNRRFWAEVDRAERQGAARLGRRLAPALAVACAAAAAMFFGAASGREMARAIAPETQREVASAEWPTAALAGVPRTSLGGAYMELSGGGDTR